MKLKNLLYGAAAIALAASCSSDNDFEPSQNAASTGDGYIAVKINLPSRGAASRGANDNYNDGKAEEYYVDQVALLLFSGDSEDKAKFEAAYDIRDIEKHPDTDDNGNFDNITTTMTKTVRIDNINKAGSNLYGLVLINYNGVGYVNEEDHTFLLNGAPVQNFSDFTTGLNTELSNFTGEDNDHFFMANAVLSNQSGASLPSNPAITTLVKMNDQVFDTETLAQANPVATFFVERAVAKATLQIEEDADKKIDPKSSVTINNDNLAEGEAMLPASVFDIDDVKWMLGNREPSSFIVRNVGQANEADQPFFPWSNYTNAKYNGGVNPYRFFGTVTMGTNGSWQPEVENCYRTYWCYDPHYAAGNNLPNQNDSKRSDWKSTGFNNPLYCHENTFCVANQNHLNTTCALLKVTLKNKGTFYTINGNDNILYASREEATSYVRKYIVESQPVQDAIKKQIPTGQLGDILPHAQKYVDITFDRDNDGYCRVKAISFNNVDGKLKGVPSFSTSSESTNLVTNANLKYRIAEYRNGESFYDIRFKHFAADELKDEINPLDLAPWFDAKANTLTTADSYITNPEANFLGRYGMVRNNWYDLTITAIRHLGRPAPVDIQFDLPDDEQHAEEWISFRVNILSWALRTQHNEL